MDEYLINLVERNEKKIAFLILDGLGGLPLERGGKTELESAVTPNLDAMAADSECGLHQPMGFGVTPGSAPGHFALFGYRPIDYPIGRGVVAAMGIGFPMKAGDVAARMNFASRDEQEKITDRRAGRIPTEECAGLCEQLKQVAIPGVEVFVKPVQDYRAVVIFRGEGLSDRVADTDPQKVGVRALDPEALSPAGEKTAAIAKEFIGQSLEILKNEKPANAVLMRGFAELPHIPSMKELFGLKPLALAVYPDYKGISRLLGMQVIESLANLDDQLAALKSHWQNFNFFFIHHKYTDSRGEDGDFKGKVAEIEKVDAVVPKILAMKPDVLVVTGDHSTPALLKAHSSHPVPFLIQTPQLSLTRSGGAKEFGERACSGGVWGVIESINLIRIALGYAGKLKKYGA